jgi:hypothetical protein
VRALAKVRADVRRAKIALAALRREESEIVEARAACPLCKAPRGMPCVKPSLIPRAPHSERHWAAK